MVEETRAHTTYIQTHTYSGHTNYFSDANQPNACKIVFDSNLFTLHELKMAIPINYNLKCGPCMHAQTHSHTHLVVFVCVFESKFGG